MPLSWATAFMKQSSVPTSSDSPPLQDSQTPLAGKEEPQAIHIESSTSDNKPSLVISNPIEEAGVDQVQKRRSKVKSRLFTHSDDLRRASQHLPQQKPFFNLSLQPADPTPLPMLQSSSSEESSSPLPSRRSVIRLSVNSIASESLLSTLPQKSPKPFFSKRLPSPPIHELQNPKGSSPSVILNPDLQDEEQHFGSNLASIHQKHGHMSQDLNQSNPQAKVRAHEPIKVSGSASPSSGTLMEQARQSTSNNTGSRTPLLSAFYGTAGIPESAVRSPNLRSSTALSPRTSIHDQESQKSPARLTTSEKRELTQEEEEKLRSKARRERRKSAHTKTEIPSEKDLSSKTKHRRKSKALDPGSESHHHHDSHPSSKTEVGKSSERIDSEDLTVLKERRRRSTSKRSSSSKTNEPTSGDTPDDKTRSRKSRPKSVVDVTSSSSSRRTDPDQVKHKSQRLSHMPRPTVVTVGLDRNSKMFDPLKKFDLESLQRSSATSNYSPLAAFLGASRPSPQVVNNPIRSPAINVLKRDECMLKEDSTTVKDTTPSVSQVTDQSNLVKEVTPCDELHEVGKHDSERQGFATGEAEVPKHDRTEDQKVIDTTGQVRVSGARTLPPTLILGARSSHYLNTSCLSTSQIQSLDVEDEPSSSVSCSNGLNVGQEPACTGPTIASSEDLSPSGPFARKESTASTASTVGASSVFTQLHSASTATSASSQNTEMGSSPSRSAKAGDFDSLSGSLNTLVDPTETLKMENEGDGCRSIACKDGEEDEKEIKTIPDDKLMNDIDQVLADLEKTFFDQPIKTDSENGSKDDDEVEEVKEGIECQIGREEIQKPTHKFVRQLRSNLDSDKFVSGLESVPEGQMVESPIENNLEKIEEQSVGTSEMDGYDKRVLGPQLDQSPQKLPRRKLSSFFMNAAPDLTVDGMVNHEEYESLQNRNLYGSNLVDSPTDEPLSGVEPDELNLMERAAALGDTNVSEADVEKRDDSQEEELQPSPSQAEQILTSQTIFEEPESMDSMNSDQVTEAITPEAVEKDADELKKEFLNEIEPKDGSSGDKPIPLPDVNVLYTRSERKKLLESMTKKSPKIVNHRRATAPALPKAGTKALSKKKESSEDVAAVEEPKVKIPKPRFEHALLRYPNTILVRIISHMDYLDFYTLPQISRKLRYGLNAGEPREVVLEKFLGDVGYRKDPAPDSLYMLRMGGQNRYTGDGIRYAHRQTIGSSHAVTKPTRPNLSRQFRSSTSGMNNSFDSRNALPITLKDLHAYYTGLEFSPDELCDLAEKLRNEGLDLPTFRMIRASTRAYNKLLIRIRSQTDSSSENERDKRPRTLHLGKRLLPIYAPGKPAVLKVWIPAIDDWMTREELVECERELWKSEIRPFMRKGDVCWNTAMGASSNEGRVLFDGRMLQDLQFSWDPIGHLPEWLNMFVFPPSYYHHVIASTTTTPVFYLDLTEFKSQVQDTMELCQDKFNKPSQQVTRRTSVYRVQRWVYRSVIKINPGTKTGIVEDLPGWEPTDSGMGMIHRDWVGKIVIEVEGTAEKARDLLARCTKASVEKLVPVDHLSTIRFANKEKQSGLRLEMRRLQLSPWKIVRERSRPGLLWIQALYHADDSNYID